MTTCDACEAEFQQNSGRGRKARFCSTACRMRAYRSRKSIPAKMRHAQRWVAADGKRPVRPNGRPASSTDPTTWSSIDEVADRPHGFMLGEGIGCYDLDDVTDAQVHSFAASIPERIIYAERSMSGSGAHLFIEAPESRGWKRVINGISVERYTRARFIRMTKERISI